MQQLTDLAPTVFSNLDVLRYHFCSASLCFSKHGYGFSSTLERKSVDTGAPASGKIWVWRRRLTMRRRIHACHMRRRIPGYGEGD
jgi:hypothetical protein